MTTPTPEAVIRNPRDFKRWQIGVFIGRRHFGIGWARAGGAEDLREPSGLVQQLLGASVERQELRLRLLCRPRRAVVGRRMEDQLMSEFERELEKLINCYSQEKEEK